MDLFKRRKPGPPEMQHSIIEALVGRADPELAALDLILWQQSMREPATRNLDLIDRVLDERLAVSRALVPVIPGRTS